MKQLIYLLLFLAPLCSKAQSAEDAAKEELNYCQNRVNQLLDRLNGYMLKQPAEGKTGVFIIKNTKVDESVSIYQIDYKSAGKLVSRAIIQGDRAMTGGGMNFKIELQNNGSALRVHVGGSMSFMYDFNVFYDNEKGFYSSVIKQP